MAYNKLYIPGVESWVLDDINVDLNVGGSNDDDEVARVELDSAIAENNDEAQQLQAEGVALSTELHLGFKGYEQLSRMQAYLAAGGSYRTLEQLFDMRQYLGRRSYVSGTEVWDSIKKGAGAVWDFIKSIFAKIRDFFKRIANWFSKSSSDTEKKTEEVEKKAEDLKNKGTTEVETSGDVKKSVDDAKTATAAAGNELKNAEKAIDESKKAVQAAANGSNANSAASSVSTSSATNSTGKNDKKESLISTKLSIDEYMDTVRALCLMCKYHQDFNKTLKKLDLEMDTILDTVNGAISSHGAYSPETIHIDDLKRMADSCLRTLTATRARLDEANKKVNKAATIANTAKPSNTK